MHLADNCGQSALELQILSLSRNRQGLADEVAWVSNFC